MRLCPFPNCGLTIQSDRFACPKHWYQLNTLQRDKVWDGYNRYTSGEIGMAELTEIQEEVIAAWKLSAQHEGAAQACRSCHASIYWRRIAKTGKSMPIDVASNDQGNIVIDNARECRIVNPEDAAVARARGELTFISHFVTCPYSAQHRRSR